MEEEFIKPKIIDQEVFLEPNKPLVSKTDKHGVFEFANKNFIEMSGYQEYEIMGKSMFCIQHPDMPKTFFKHVWERLLEGKNTSIVVKNLIKSGKYYWSLTHFTFKFNEEDGEIISIYSRRTTPNKEAVTYFSKIFKTLLNLEQKNSLESADKYMLGFLEEKQTTFNSLVLDFHPKSQNEKTQEKTNKKEIKNLFFEFDKPTKKIIKTPTKVITTIIPDKVVPIKVTPEIVPDKTVLDKVTPIKVTPEIVPDKTVLDKVTPIEKNIKSPKKSLLQKLFGKTEEEIEAEKKRREKR